MKYLTRLLVFWAITANSFNAAKACSSFLGPEGYRISLFLPYTYYKPWLGFFQYNLYTSEDPSISLATEHDRQLNCAQWKTYCGASVKQEDIYFVMYQMPPGYFLQVINEPLQPGKTETSNTFIRWILEKEHISILRYMQFAKYCESVSVQKVDPWDEDILDTDHTWQKYYTIGYTEMVKCPDPFLQQRWAFQFNRMHAYGAAYEDTVNMAKKIGLETPTKSQLVAGWNCAYMAVRCMDNPVEANIWLAHAFDLTQDKKYFAMKYFSSAHLRQTIGQIKNDQHLCAVVYGLAALNQQEICMDLLQKIMEHDLNSEVFEITVTREIQKIEDRLMTEKITGFFPASSHDYGSQSIYYEKDLLQDYYDKQYKTKLLKEVSHHGVSTAYYQAYAGRLLDLLEQVLEKKSLNNKGFFHLAAAHLCWCLNRYQQMQQHLQEAGLYIKKGHALELNLRMEKVLAQQLVQKGLNVTTENTVHDILVYLETHNGYDAVDLEEQFCMSLMAHYERSGERYKTTLLMPGVKGLYRALAVEGQGWAGDYTNSFTRYFASTATLKDADDMMRFFDRKDHSRLEQYLAKEFSRDSLNYDLLMEWVGSVYIRNEKWEKALEVFQRVDKNYWNLKVGEDHDVNYKGQVMWRWTYYPFYLNVNPFYAKVSNNHGASLADSVRYNKLTFVKQWIKLQHEASSKNQVVRDHAQLQLANARYNMTWYGNAWIIWRNEWSAYENKYWPGFEKEYYACENAHRAYEALYQSTTDQEIKSRCCIMLALCDRNKAYYLNRKKHDYHYSGGPYLDLFMKKYNGTETYERLMSTCYGEEAFISTIQRDDKQGW